MTDLLVRQNALQMAADQVVATLGLDALLRLAGSPQRVGSSALGLMTRRDIDITVTCENLQEAARAALPQIVGALLPDPRIGAIRFRNDCASWNREPHIYPDGLYIGITYRHDDGEDWNLDIWLVDRPERQPDLRHVRTVLPRLSETTRRTILAIKTAIDARPDRDATPIPGYLVHVAVLDGGVTDFSKFIDWMKRQA